MHFAHNPLPSSLNAEPIKAKPRRGRFQDRVTNYEWCGMSDKVSEGVLSLLSLKFVPKQEKNRVVLAKILILGVSCCSGEVPLDIHDV